MAGRLLSAAVGRSARRKWKQIAQVHSSALAVKDDRFTRFGSPIPKIVDHSSVLARPQTRVTTLPSGLRVATEAGASTHTATVGVWIDAGSRFETAETNGTAHFLEHMIFKGTAKRSLRQLEEEIENMGGHLNAYTSREQTTYYGKFLESDIPVAVDILADILQNSSFDEDRINRERSVILREMQEVEGQVEEVLFDHLHATAFQYSPLGRTILGPADNIQSITRANLKDYISTHYTAPRMVIAGAGAVDHDQLVKLVKEKFANLPTDSTTAAELVQREPAIFTGSEVRIRDDDAPLCNFSVAVQGASWTDPDSIPLMVMQAMLGSWNKSAGAGKHMGSEMAQKIAANDLAESVMAFNTNYSDSGLFGVYAVAKPECLADLSYAIMHEFARLIYRVDEDDLARARNQLKGSLLLHLDGASPICEDIGRQILTYGRRIPLEELLARIDAVDSATIKRVATRFIFDKDVAVAAMGATLELPEYLWFRRRTYWLRY